MAIVQDFLAWLQRLFGAGDPKARCGKHLRAIELRKQSYEDQRKEIEGETATKEAQQRDLHDKLTGLVAEGKGKSVEAGRLGHELDALKEEIQGLLRSAEHRRIIEQHLRRVLQTGKDLLAMLPQHPSIAAELEDNLGQLVQGAKAESADALGQLTEFVAAKLQQLKDSLKPIYASQVEPEMSDAQKKALRELEDKQRADLEDAEGPETQPQDPREKQRPREIDAPDRG